MIINTNALAGCRTFSIESRYPADSETHVLIEQSMVTSHHRRRRQTHIISLIEKAGGADKQLPLTIVQPCTVVVSCAPDSLICLLQHHHQRCLYHRHHHQLFLFWFLFFLSLFLFVRTVG